MANRKIIAFSLHTLFIVVYILETSCKEFVLHKIENKYLANLNRIGFEVVRDVRSACTYIFDNYKKMDLNQSYIQMSKIAHAEMKLYVPLRQYWDDYPKTRDKKCYKYLLKTMTAIRKVYDPLRNDSLKEQYDDLTRAVSLVKYLRDMLKHEGIVCYRIYEEMPEREDSPYADQVEQTKDFDAFAQIARNQPSIFDNINNCSLATK